MAVKNIQQFFISLLAQYRDAALFIILLLKALGIPLPGESVLLLGGFLASGTGNTLTVAGAITASTVGTFGGSMVAYAIGRRWGNQVLLAVGHPFRLTKERLDRYNAGLRRHGGLYVTFSRFVPVARLLVPYWSGAAGIDPVKSALCTLTGGAVWCATFILLGCAAGRDWVILSTAVGTCSLILVALMVLIFAALKYLKRYKSTVLIFSAAFTAFLLFSCKRMQEELAPFDSRIYLALSAFINYRLTSIMKFISDLGSVYAAAALAALLLTVLSVRRKRLFYGFMASANFLLVTLLNVFFKLIFHRARPTILQLISAPGYSFPSGHSMISAAFYGYLIYLCTVYYKGRPRRIACFLLGALILCIGLSRIYLGVHFASDVICGFFAGLAWLAMYIAVTETLFDHPHRRVR